MQWSEIIALCKLTPRVLHLNLWEQGAQSAGAHTLPVGTLSLIPSTTCSPEHHKGWPPKQKSKQFRIYWPEGWQMQLTKTKARKLYSKLFRLGFFLFLSGRPHPAMLRYYSSLWCWRSKLVPGRVLLSTVLSLQPLDWSFLNSFPLKPHFHLRNTTQVNTARNA